MKILKSIFFIFLLIFFVGGLTVAALNYLLDPNKLKSILVAEIQKKTGYQLEMNEKLSWTFYPGLSIRVPHLSLLLPHQSQPLLEAKNIHFSMAIWPLLKSVYHWNGDIYISTLIFNQVHADNIRATLSIDEAKKTIMVAPLQADLYQGKLEGVVTFAYAANNHWQGRIQIDNVQIKPLLQDMQGDHSKIMVSGTGHASLQAETQGDTQAALLQGLNGQGEFSVKDGFLEGIDIHYWLETANALFNKEASVPDNNTGQTPYNALTGTLQIQSGVASTPDLLVAAPAFTVKGQGSLVLNASTVHLQLQAKPNLANANVHWEIPILINGSLNAPTIKLDTSHIYKAIPAEQIEKILPGKAGQFLQRLLGT